MSPSPPPQPPPAPRNASTALARLNAAVEEIEDLKEASATLRREVATILKALHLENNTLRAEVTALAQRVAILETALGLDIDGETGAADGEDVVVDAGEDATRDELAKITKSLALVNSQAIKNTVNVVFKHLMGVTTLVPDKLPPHPDFPTGEAPTVVPIDEATNEPFLRFRWDKDGKHRSNAPGLQKVITAVRTLGPGLYPTSTALLPAILDAHIKERVLTKYKYLHGEWSRGHEVDEEEEVGGNGEGVEPEGEEIFEEDARLDAEDGNGRKEKASQAGKSKNKRATHNSRASATLAIRLRKRAAHPEYSKPRYDSGFILNAMSDEEDDDDAAPGTAKRYKSCSPGYRSALAKQMYLEVDVLPDPSPDKSGRGMVRRVRGEEIVNAIPPKAKNLKNRVRAWQVDPELLAKNPGWLTSGRVAQNGMLWGDAEDPVEEEPKASKRKEVPGGHTVDVVALKRRRRQVDTAEAAKHQSELDTVLYAHRPYITRCRPDL